MDDEGYLLVTDPEAADHPTVYREDFELADLKNEVAKSELAQREGLTSALSLEQEVMRMLDDLRAVDVPVPPPPPPTEDDGAFAPPTPEEVTAAVEALPASERDLLMTEARRLFPDYVMDEDEELGTILRCIICFEVKEECILWNATIICRECAGRLASQRPPPSHPLTREAFRAEDLRPAPLVGEFLACAVRDRRERVREAQMGHVRRVVEQRIAAERATSAELHAKASVEGRWQRYLAEMGVWRAREAVRREALRQRLRQSAEESDISEPIARALRQDEHLQQMRERIIELESVLRERRRPLQIDHERAQLWERPRDSCSGCAQPFVALRRPHHCRRCGRLMCMFCLVGVGYPEESKKSSYAIVCGRCRHVCARTSHRRAVFEDNTLIPSDRLPQWHILRPEQHRITSLTTPLGARWRQLQSLPMTLGETIQAAVELSAAKIHDAVARKIAGASPEPAISQGADPTDTHVDDEESVCRSTRPPFEPFPPMPRPEGSLYLRTSAPALDDD